MRADLAPYPIVHDASQPAWSQLLIDAIAKPGLIASAYSAFWNYSIGNQFSAAFQCLARGLALGPIHTFRGWLDLGRHVRKGEKALTLCMPVTVRQRKSDQPSIAIGGDGAERQAEVTTLTRFVFRNHWFVLSQTDGEDYAPVTLPAWDEFRALHALLIRRVAFRHADGNVQGYACGRDVAVSPIAFMPHRTLFHELAHVVLGHCEELAGLSDADESTPRDLREVEAECVALICSECLALPGADFSRGYIQHWIGRQLIPDRSAQHIFRAADAILKSGQEVQMTSPSDATH